jgi:general secretion pathway protein G
VFFAWERRTGLLSAATWRRVRLGALGAFALVLFAWLHARESHAAAVRATRAKIAEAVAAGRAYRADRGGECPPDFLTLVRGRYLREVPTDAWGRPLRLLCPGRRDVLGFDVMSDGPDGVPGGLDRVE